MKQHLLLSSAVCVIVSSLASAAQARTLAGSVDLAASAVAGAGDAGSVSASAAQQSSEQSAPAASAGASVPSNEIVVTALRANTNIQRAAAAITVVGGEQIREQHILNASDLQSVIPGSRIELFNSSTHIFLRGIGSLLDFYYVPEVTALNFNGTYLPRFATTGAFYDIDNVEALPGPQGVLYGRSAGGGAILVNSRKPTTDHNEVYGQAEYGNYNTIHVEGAGNMVVSDKVALRLAGTYQKHNGYESFDFQNQNAYSLRLSALIKPTENLSLLLWGTYYQNDFKPEVTLFGQPLLNPADPFQIPAIDPTTKLSNDLLEDDFFRYYLAGYDATYHAGGVTIDYTGSFLRQREDAIKGANGKRSRFQDAMDQFSQSLHANGKIGKLDLVGGVDYLHGGSFFFNNFGFETTFQGGVNFPTLTIVSKSVFAQGTFHISPAVRVVGGARYSRDSLGLSGFIITANGGGAPFVNPAPGGQAIGFGHTWAHTDLKGGIEADIAPKVLLYANVQTGFAPGSLNTVTDAQLTQYNVLREVQPQTVLAYTAGFKSRLLNDKLTFNVEGYDYEYKKLIIQSTVPGVPVSLLLNVPKSRIYGAQVEAAFSPSPNTKLAVTVAYTHGAYGSFVVTVPGIATPVQLDGLQTAFTPAWTGNVSLMHRIPLASGASFDARANMYFSSSYWGLFSHTSNTRQSGYTNTDLTLGFNTSGDHYRIAVWAKNLENRTIGGVIAGSGYAPNPEAILLEPPKTYGVTLGFKM